MGLQFFDHLGLSVGEEIAVDWYTPFTEGRIIVVETDLATDKSR